MAVFGTMLTHVTRSNVTDTLQARGLSAEQARDTAHHVSSSITGSGDASPPSGTGAAASQMRDLVSTVRMDFAEANQWVFYGMAVALGIAFLFALRHPGGTPAEATADGGVSSAEDAAASGALSAEDAQHRHTPTRTD